MFVLMLFVNDVVSLLVEVIFHMNDNVDLVQEVEDSLRFGLNSQALSYAQIAYGMDPTNQLHMALVLECFHACKIYDSAIHFFSTSDFRGVVTDRIVYIVACCYVSIFFLFYYFRLRKIDQSTP